MTFLEQHPHVRTLKVAIMGPESSGKTTLTQRVAEITGLPVRGECVKDIIERWKLSMNCPKEWTPIQVLEHIRLVERNYLSFQQDLQQHVAELEGRMQGFVADRSPIDAVAYLLRYVRDPALDEEVEAYAEKAQELLRRNFDLVFYLPPVIPIDDNKVRVLSRSARSAMHYLMIGMLEDWRIHYSIVHNLDLEARAWFIVSKMINGPYRRK